MSDGFLKKLKIAISALSVANASGSCLFSLPGSCLVTHCLGGSASDHSETCKVIGRLSLQFIGLPGRSLVTSWWCLRVKCQRKKANFEFAFLGHFSLIATIWFPGSAWEPNELQALPAVASLKPTTREAEPRRQCVPRQEPGNERIRGGVQREVLKFMCFLEEV